MQLNHALLLVSDLDEMSQFLIRTLGLKEGQRPPFGFTGVWLYDERNVPCIHIAGRNDINPEQSFYLGHDDKHSSTPSLPTVDHLAFTSNDYQGLKGRLLTYNVPFVEREIPEANEHQVFITGPDGLKIEILFSRNDIH
jgi:lactoylglutathione lyase